MNKIENYSDKDILLWRTNGDFSFFCAPKSLWAVNFKSMLNFLKRCLFFFETQNVADNDTFSDSGHFVINASLKI